MKKIKVILIAIFAIILFIIGNYIYPNIQEYIPFRDYTYDISPSYVEYIRNLEIYHNFSSNEGMIAFEFEKMGAINKTNGFEISFPITTNDILILEEVNGTIKKYTDWKTFINIGRWENFTRIILGDELPLSKDAKYILNYEMKISPNSIIRLDHDNVKTYGYAPRIYLNLGKDYLCTAECIEPIQNMKINYWSTEKEFVLEPSLNNYQENTDYHHSVRLHVIGDIRTRQGFFLGCIVSLIILIITLIKELVEDY